MSLPPTSRLVRRAVRLALGGVLASPLAHGQEFRTFVGASNTLWESPTNWNPNLVPDSITEGARVEVSGVQVGSNLVISALELDGSGGIVLNQSNELRTSTLVHSGSTVAGTGTLWVTNAGTISSVSGVVFSQCTFRSDGNLAIGNGVDFQLGAVFDNRGQTELTDNSSVTASGVPNTAIAENTGFFRKLNGTGTATFSIPVNNSNTITSNAGTLRVTAGGTSTGNFTTGAGGTLDIRNRDFTMLDGSSVFGDGETVLRSTFDVPAGNAITLDNFTLIGLGRLQGGGEIRFLGTDCRLEDGALSGTVLSKVPNGAVLSLPTGSGVSVEDTHELRVEPGGTLLWSDPNAVLSSNGNGILRNQGVLDFAGDGDLNQNGVSASTLMTLINEPGGVIRKSATNGGDTQIVAELQSAGQVQVQAGIMEVFRDSTFSGPILIDPGAILRLEQPSTLQSGTVVSGDGVLEIRNITSIPSGVTVDAQNVTLVGSNPVIGGDGLLRIGDEWSWQSGRLEDDVTVEILPGAECFIDTTSSKQFGSGSTPTILNRGTIRSIADSAISSDGAATLDNRGVLDLASDLDLTVNSGSPMICHNTGSIIKSIDGGGDSLLNMDLTHEGVFDVQAGYLRLRGNHDLQAPITVQPGARLRFGGSSLNQILMRDGSALGGGGDIEHQTGTIEVEGGARLEVFGYDAIGASAKVAGAGTFAYGEDLSTAYILHSGSGVTEIPAGRTVTATSQFDLDEGRTLRVLGTMEWASNFNSSTTNGVTLDIEGTLDITSGMALQHGGGIYTIHNTGTIRSRAPGTSFANVAPDIYTGDGLLAIESGRLRLQRSVTLSGTIEVHPGAELLCSQTLTFGPGSSLKGSGLIQSNPVFSGTVSPGMSIGTLDISGGGSFPGGTLSVELGNGTSDLLNASGTVNLTGGKLEVAPVSGYTPSDGESWTVLEAASVTGTFDAVLQPPPTSGFGYLLTYNPTSVVVTYSALDSFEKAYEAATGTTLAPGTDLAALGEQNLDGDHLPNLVDWAFGGSLSAADPGRNLIIDSVTPGNPRTIALRYPVNPLASDVTVKLTGSGDPASGFTEKTLSGTSTTTIDGILFLQGTLSLPSTDPSRFFRVEASLP